MKMPGLLKSINPIMVKTISIVYNENNKTSIPVISHPFVMVLFSVGISP
jgi:hypothetical protein